MTPLDIFNSTNGLNDFLTTLYGKGMTSKQKAEGTAMYNKFKSIKNSGGGGGYTPSGGNTPSGDGGNFGLSDILSKLTNIVNGTVKFTAGITKDIYLSQLGQGTTSTVKFDEDTAGKFFDIIQRNGISISAIQNSIEKSYDQILDQLRKESSLKSEINEKTTLTGELSEMLREDMLQSSIYAAKFGYSLSDLGNLYINLVENSGKFALLNQKTLDDAAPIVRSFVGDMETMGKTIAEFEKVGIGANRTLKTIEEAGIRSMSLGLNARKVVTQITENIEKVNQYGFQNGIRGLESMVRKSTEFRMNMQNVFDITEKVMNPEGALELAANLQVLGGAFGDFNDPIKMMYDATNNVEGLQDSLIGAAQSLATYNTEQGRFEISGVNLRRAREMASQLGISLQDLTKTAIGAAERTSAATAMLSSGLQMSEDDKEFLMNMSRMEGGEMKIILPESLAKQLNRPAEIALDELDQKTADALVAYEKQMSKMDAKEVAINQLTMTEQIGRNVDLIATYFKIQSVKTITGVGKGLGLDEEYRKLREYIENEGKTKLNSRGNNIEGNAELKTREIKTKVDDFLENPVEGSKNLLKTGGEKLLDVIQNLVNDLLSKNTSNISKEDLTDGFYNGMIKYDTIRKKETASINIQNIDGKGYFSNEPINS